MTETTTLTEFEESVSFDADDPDFAPPTSDAVRNVLLRDARRFADAKYDVSKVHIIKKRVTRPDNSYDKMPLAYGSERARSSELQHAR